MISQDHIGPGLQGGSLASSGVVYPQRWNQPSRSAKVD